MLEEKAFCGTPLVAGTHGPVARFVVICKAKLVPADAGQRTKICPPVLPMDNDGMLVLIKLMERDWLVKPPRLSAACTLKLNVLLVAAVPERRPFVARFRFASRLPDDNDQL